MESLTLIGIVTMYLVQPVPLADSALCAENASTGEYTRLQDAPRLPLDRGACVDLTDPRLPYYLAGPLYDGPLYCDGRIPGGPYTTETAIPWIALDVNHYKEGRVSCGAKVLVEIEGYPAMVMQALDAGPLARYCVESGETCAPIIGDIPSTWAPFPGLSVKGKITILGRD